MTHAHSVLTAVGTDWRAFTARVPAPSYTKGGPFYSSVGTLPLAFGTPSLQPTTTVVKASRLTLHTTHSSVCACVPLSAPSGTQHTVWAASYCTVRVTKHSTTTMVTLDAAHSE